jgi:predicted outer membrane repeat protein
MAILIMLGVILFTLLTSVSASDLNESAVSEIEDSLNDEIAVSDDDFQDVLNEKTVDNDDSDILNVNHTPKTFNDIKSSVENANDGDTIVLDGYYSFPESIEVEKTLHFIGINNATVDGGSNVQLFEIGYVNNVTFKNIKFQNGHDSNDGGAIYKATRGYTVENCIFINNYAYYGGALYNPDFAINCTFINNDASMGGSGMTGGTAINCRFIYNKKAPLRYANAVNCSFINNTNQGFSGGAICNGDAENCIFINNSAHSGGAIAFGNAVNCSFFNNDAGDGGAMYGGSAVNCSFINNYASTGGAVYSSSKIENCRFINNSATEEGGAVGTSTIFNSTFINNTAQHGGAVENSNVTYSSFTNNSANERGGAIYIGYKYTKMSYSIIDCIFNNNSAEDAGAIYCYDGLGLNVFNCTFNNSTSAKGDCIYVYKNIKYDIADSIFDVAPTSLDYYYNSFLYAGDVFIVFGNEGTLVVNLSDVRGPLCDKTITISINTHEYNITTDQVGIAVFNITKYITDIGKYNTQVAFAGYEHNIPISLNVTVTLSVLHHTELNAADLTFFNGEEGILVANLSDDRGVLVGKTVIFTVNKVNHNVPTDSNGMAILNISQYLTKPGNYVIPIAFAGDEENTNASINATVIIERHVASLIVNNLSIYNGENAILIANLTNANGPLEGKLITLFVNGGNCTNRTDSNGLAYFNVKDYFNDMGQFDVTLNFEGDDYDEAASANAKVIINKYLPTISVNNLSIIRGDDGILTVSLSNVLGPLSNKVVYFKINNRKYNKTTYSNGVVTFNIKNYITNLGAHDVEVGFDGDTLNMPISTNARVNMNSYIGNLSVTQSGKYYHDTTLTFKLTNVRTGESIPYAPITLKFSNDESVDLITDTNGVATHLITFDPATYSLTARVTTPNVDVNQVVLNDIEIEKVVGNINITQVGTSRILKVVLYNPSNGDLYRNIEVNLQFSNDEKADVSTDDEGIAKFNIPFEKGIYSVLASVSPIYGEFANAEMYGINITTEYEPDVNNTFYSKISFGNPIVFDYSKSGSTTFSILGGKVGEISVIGHKEAKITLTGNVITVSNLAVGSYKLLLKTIPDENYYANESTVDITVNKVSAVVSASKITVALKKSGIWKVTIVDSKTGKPISNLKLTIKVYTGKKYKTVTVTTNSKGVATYQTKKLSKGTHKIVVSSSHPGYRLNTFTSSIKVIKQKKLTFKVSKQKNPDSSSVVFRVFHKGKAVNGVKLNLLVYTGKKIVKTIKLKTTTVKKKKGIVGYTTNELSVGTHKVKLVPASIKYSGSKKSKLKLTKSQVSKPAVSSKISG